MHQYNSAPTTGQAETLNPELTAEILAVIEGQRSVGHFSFRIPVGPKEITHCIFCKTSIVDFKLADGQWFGATVETDAQGINLADLGNPHCCPESQRWEQFLDAPSGSDSDGDEQ
jgi:hypothetical protein